MYTTALYLIYLSLILGSVGYNWVAIMGGGIKYVENCMPLYACRAGLS